MNDEHRRTVLRRLKSIEGHLRGVERMVDADAYCVDVLKQTHAVQKALDRVNALILQNHLQECVTTAIRGADTKARQKMLAEIVDVFELSQKI